MNKDIIIEKSSKMFYSHGFKTVTMDDISKNLGISKKTLYEVFSSKNELIIACSQLTFKQIKNSFDEIFSKKLGAIEELMECVNFIVTFFNTPEKERAFYQLKKYYRKIYIQYYELDNELIKEILIKNFKRGIKEKMIRQEIEPDQYVNLFLLTQYYIHTNLELVDDHKKVSQFGKLNFDIFMRGILTTEGLNKYEKLKLKINK